MAKIQQTFSMGDANIIATITEMKGKADLCVFLVGSPGLAYGDDRWYITTRDGEASKKIYFGKSGRSELKVCFVNNPADAGWQTQHRLQGRL